MKLIKIIPKSQRAKNRVREHGVTMELLLDRGDSFIVRSVEDTFKSQDATMSKWIGTFKEEEAAWEEV
jgi:hypothetical protein